MVRFLGIVSAIVFLSGCASQSQPETSASGGKVVAMTDFSFSPRQITVAAGDTVQWRNDSIISWHTVTCDPSKAKKPDSTALPAGAEPFDSGRVNSHGVYSYTFTTPGTYRYFCKPHEGMGMIGEVTVK
jgi:plastocyanin